MDELKDIRDKIDKIDEKLVKLLNQRAKLGVKIAEVKAKTGSPVFIPAREKQILAKVSGLNKGPLGDKAVRHVFREIFSATRSVEKSIKVACLGPAGSFSHLATTKLFGSSSEHLLRSDIDAVFSDVERGIADYGVAPIENIIEGDVGRTMDLFIDSPVNIYGEAYYDIHINLLSKAKKIGDVKTIYTHYMPLGQCRGWIARYLPKAKIIETASSAEASIKASKSATAAALGAAEAAKIYGLGILAEKIEERAGNKTRFLILSLNHAPPSGDDKTSIMFALKDKPGALTECLKPFATKNLSMSKIQSRPSPDREWEYLFFVDFDRHADDRDAKWALKKVEAQSQFLKMLGSYPNGR